jgi:hypothetical protein
MAMGPVAGAIVVWRCSYYFGSYDHVVSVLIHLLPALALSVHRHVRRPHCAGELLPLPCRTAASLELDASRWDSWWWLTIAPMLAYVGWQLSYYLVVQVGLACF